MRAEVEPTRGSMDRTDCNDSGALRTTTPESIMSLVEFILPPPLAAYRPSSADRPAEGKQ